MTGRKRTAGRSPSKPNPNLALRHLAAAKLLGTITMRADAWPDGVDPEATYALQLDGDCLEPMVLDGSRVVIDTKGVPKNGDLAVIWHKDGKRSVVKRLVMVPPPEMMSVGPGSNVMPIVIAEQFNPQGRYHINVDQISAIYPVIAVAPPGDGLAVPVAEVLKNGGVPAAEAVGSVS